MDRVWQAPVHGVTNSQTQLSDYHFHLGKNVPGIRDCVQLTQDKARDSPRAWPLGKPDEGDSLMYLAPTVHLTCQQANSLSQMDLCVLGSRQSTRFLKSSLLFHHQLPLCPGYTSSSTAE